MYQNPYKTVGMAGFLLPGTAIGEILYVHDVDGDDDDRNSGLDPASPLQTITEALTRCTSGNNDVIIVMHYADNPTLDAAWPIRILIDNVSLIGSQSGCFIQTKTTVNSDGDTSCFIVEASHVLIRGFRFQPGGSASGVTFDGHNGDIAILDCNFELGTYGVYSPDEGISYGLEVSRCVFVAPSSHGVYIDDNPGTSRYKDNVFHLTIDNSVGIEINAGGNDEILDNRFGNKDASPVNGWAITLSGTAVDAIVDGNSAMIAGADPSATPYLDTTGGGNCNWGRNYAGDDRIYPT